ncbi:hypothetical protein QE152_g10554 [Popillia japonica]|uniref:Uncharacterized protein n=1 Tax=Popillia japonica TaxID=7064 RepID=A0AAW1LUF1_POPJA
MHFVKPIKMETDHYVPSNSPTTFAPYQVHHNFFNYLPYPHSPTLYQNFDSRDYFDQQDPQNFLIYQKNVIARGIEDILGSSGGQFSDGFGITRYQRYYDSNHDCNSHYYEEKCRDELQNENSDLKLYGGTPPTNNGLFPDEWSSLLEKESVNLNEKVEKSCKEGLKSGSSSISSKLELLGEYE